MVLAFSWKKAKQQAIKKLKYRMEIHKQNGNMDNANACKRKIDRLSK